MKWRCYVCTYELGSGMPPLEALSKRQAEVVGGVNDAIERFDVFAGTRFDGMSTYSFCEFCLLALRQFGDVPGYVPGHMMEWHLMDTETFNSKITCECHMSYIIPNGANSSALGNRWAILHRIEMSRDMRSRDLLHILPIDMGMKYGKYNECDYCGLYRASRGMGSESTGGDVLSICEACDNNHYVNEKDTLPEDETF